MAWRTELDISSHRLDRWKPRLHQIVYGSGNIYDVWHATVNYQKLQGIEAIDRYFFFGEYVKKVQMKVYFTTTFIRSNLNNFLTITCSRLLMKSCSFKENPKVFQGSPQSTCFLRFSMTITRRRQWRSGLGVVQCTIPFRVPGLNLHLSHVFGDML